MVVVPPPSGAQSIQTVVVPVPGEPLPPDRLQLATEALRADGMVILAGAIPMDVLDSLSAKMNEDMLQVSVNDGDLDFGDSNAVIGEEGKAGEERKPRDFRGIRPPPLHPHLHREIVYNAAAVRVSAALLGPEPTLMTYATNSSFPGSAQQGVHADCPFPAHPDHTTTNGRSPGVVLNIPLHDFTIENGATLVYPGSHLNVDPVVIASDNVGDSNAPSDAALASRHAVRPAEQPCPKRGDIVIRDLRLWHGGMPNRSDHPRAMLAMVHVAADYRGPRELHYFWGFEAEETSRDFWHDSILRTSVAFLPAPIAYQSGGHSKPRTPLQLAYEHRVETGDTYILQQQQQQQQQAKI
jgi:hypothetical protein